MSPICLTGSREGIHVSSPVTIFENFWLNTGNIFSNCLAVCTWQHSHLAEIVRTLKIRFKMKCIRVSKMPAAWTISRTVYLPSRLTIETFALPVNVKVRPDLNASLNYVPVEKLFYSPTNFLIRYPNRPINFPKWG